MRIGGDKMGKVVLMQEMVVLERHFSSRADLLDYLLMEIMLQYDQAVGSWTMKNELDDLGFDVATATIGRNLKQLDNRQFTARVSNKGRQLTREGRQEALNIRGRIQKSVLSENIVDSVEITRVQDLIEVLQTRLVIEREAARLAARNATDRDLQRMDLALEQHRTMLDEEMDDIHAGLDFHDILVKAAQNKFMSAVYRLLAFEEHQIEALYPSLGVRSHAKEYVEVHKNLRDAIASKDEEQAAKLMEDHLLEIIDVVKNDKPAS